MPTTVKGLADYLNVPENNIQIQHFHANASQILQDSEIAAYREEQRRGGKNLAKALGLARFAEGAPRRNKISGNNYRLPPNSELLEGAHRDFEDWSPTEDAKRFDLKKGNFSGLNLNGAKLAGAELPHTRFDRCQLNNANLSGINGHGMKIMNTQAKGLNLAGADLSKAFVVDSNLTESNLSRADLSQSRLEGTNFNGSDWTNARAKELTANKVNLNNVNLSNSQIDFSKDCDYDSDFVGANLEGSRLNFNNSDLGIVFNREGQNLNYGTPASIQYY